MLPENLRLIEFLVAKQVLGLAVCDAKAVIVIGQSHRAEGRKAKLIAHKSGTLLQAQMTQRSESLWVCEIELLTLAKQLPEAPPSKMRFNLEASIPPALDDIELGSVMNSAALKYLARLHVGFPIRGEGAEAK